MCAAKPYACHFEVAPFVLCGCVYTYGFVSEFAIDFVTLPLDREDSLQPESGQTACWVVQIESLFLPDASGFSSGFAGTDFACFRQPTKNKPGSCQTHGVSLQDFLPAESMLLAY